jgi:hypothetical protein
LLSAWSAFRQESVLALSHESAPRSPYECTAREEQLAAVLTPNQPAHATAVLLIAAFLAVIHVLLRVAQTAG